MSSKKGSNKGDIIASTAASVAASTSSSPSQLLVPSSPNNNQNHALNEPMSSPGKSGENKAATADLDDDDFDEVDEAEFKALANELEQIDSPILSATNSPVPPDSNNPSDEADERQSYNSKTASIPSLSSSLANSAASSNDVLSPILSPSTLISPLDIEQALQYFLGRNLSDEENQGLKSLLAAEGKEDGLTVEVLQDALQIVKDEREAEEADEPPPQKPSLIRQPSSVDPLAALKKAMRVEPSQPALTLATASSSGHNSSATTPTYAQFLRSPSSINRGSALSATYSTEASDVQGPSGSISRLIHDSHYAASGPSTPTSLHSRSHNNSSSNISSPIHRRETSIDRINLANFSPNHNTTRINSLYPPHHTHSQSLSVTPSTIASSTSGSSSTELGGMIQQLQKENARLMHAYSLLKKVNTQNESKLRESLEEIVRVKEEKTVNENSLVDVQIEYEAERKSHAKLQEKHSTLSVAHEALLKSQDTLSKKVDKLQQKNEIAAGAKNRYESLIENAHKNEIQLADKMRMEVDAEKERKYKALAQQMEAVQAQLLQSTQAFETLQTEHEALITSLQEEAGMAGAGGRKNSGGNSAFNFYSSPEFQRIRSRSKGNSMDFVASPNPSSSASASTSGGNQAVLFSYLQSMQMKGTTPRNNEHLSLAEETNESEADTSADGKENEKESLGSELAEIGEQMLERTFTEMAVQTDNPSRDELHTQTEAAPTNAMQTQTDPAASAASMRSASTETEPLPRKVEQSTSVELQVASTKTQTEENKPTVKDSATEMSTTPSTHQETQTAAKHSTDASSQSKSPDSSTTDSSNTVPKAEYEQLQSSFNVLQTSFDALQASSKSDIARAEKETVAAIVSWKQAESRVKTLTVELDDTQKLLEESNMARSMYEQRVVSMEEAFFVQQQQQLSQIMTLQQHAEANPNAAPILPISPLLPGGPNTSGGSSGSSSDASVIRIGFDRPNMAGKSKESKSSKETATVPSVATPAPPVQQSTIGTQTDDIVPAAAEKPSENASPDASSPQAATTISGEKQHNKHPIIRSKVKVDWPTESKSNNPTTATSPPSQTSSLAVASSSDNLNESPSVSVVIPHPSRGKDNASPAPKRRPMQRATTLDAAALFSDINGLVVAPSNLRGTALGSPTNHRPSASVDSSNLPASMLVSLNVLTQVEAYELGYERGVSDSSSVLLGKEKARREAEEKNSIISKKTGKKVPSVRILTPKMEMQGDSNTNSAGSSGGGGNKSTTSTPNNAQTPKNVSGAIPIKGSGIVGSESNSANPSSNNSKATSPMKVSSSVETEAEIKANPRKGGNNNNGTPLSPIVVDVSTSPPPQTVIPRPVLAVSTHVVQMQIEPGESQQDRKLSAALSHMENQLREVEREAATLQAEKASAVAEVKQAEAQTQRALQSAQLAQDELQAERVALKAAHKLTEEIRAQLFQAQHDAAMAAATIATTPPASATPVPTVAVVDAVEEKQTPVSAAAAAAAAAPKKGKKGKKLSSQIEPAPAAAPAPVVEEPSPALATAAAAPTPTKSKKSNKGSSGSSSSQQLAPETVAAAVVVAEEPTPEPVAGDTPATTGTTGGGKKKKKRGGSKQSLDLTSPAAAAVSATSSSSSASGGRALPPAAAVSQKLAAELRAIAAAPVSAQEIAAAQRYSINPSFHPVQCSIL